MEIERADFGAAAARDAPCRAETKIFVFVFSRKFIFAFREKSLRTFAKTKMYEKTDAGNGKYCEISYDVISGWCFKTNRTTVMDMHFSIVYSGWCFKTNRTTVLSMHFIIVKSGWKFSRNEISRKFAHFRFSRKWKKTRFRFNPSSLQLFLHSIGEHCLQLIGGR
jgi:hypothetical protein